MVMAQDKKLKVDRVSSEVLNSIDRALRKDGISISKNPIQTLMYR